MSKHVLKYCIAVVFALYFFYNVTQVFAKIELGYSAPPTEITSDQSFMLDVTINGAEQNVEYYIRGVFYKPDSTMYFGFTQNNEGHWHVDTNESTQFYKVVGNTTHQISFKPDTNSPYFTPDSGYLFKIGRYTAGGSLTWSDQTPAVVTIKSPAVTPTPTLTPTSTISLFPSPSLTPTFTATPTVTQVIDPHAISLSEIMACPNDDQGEWVELLNNTGSTLSLQNWKIKDSTDTHTITISNNIQAYNYLVIHLPSAIFNNSGDSVRLFTDQNALVDQMTYTACPSGTSYISANGIWQPTEAITLGLPNILVSPATPTPTPQPNMTVAPTAIPTPLITSSLSEVPSSLQYDPSLDAFFAKISIASISSSTKDASVETFITDRHSVDEKTTNSPVNKVETSLFSSTTAFLLAGCSYVLSAAMLAQKWYNLTSGV